MANFKFSFRLSSTLFFHLPLSAPITLNQIRGEPSYIALKKLVLPHSSCLFVQYSSETLNFAQKSALIQANEQILLTQKDTNLFHYYPLKNGNNAVTNYMCAYCLSDTTHPTAHMISCLNNMIHYREAMDCLLCSHVAKTEKEYSHFFDQNHNTNMNFGLIFHATTNNYTKVDMRMSYAGSYYTPATLYYLEKTLRHNMYAPIAALTIVHNHSTKDICHTSSYLQTLDTELRSRPLINNKYTTACSSNNHSYYHELPISPNLMFLILPQNCHQIDSCRMESHKTDGVTCAGFHIKITAVPDDYVFNSFFLLLQRKLMAGDTRFITYYRTKCDPEDHYKYSSDQLLLKITNYRTRIETANEPVIDNLQFEDLLSLSSFDENADPYTVFFATALTRTHYYNTLAPPYDICSESMYLNLQELNPVLIKKEYEISNENINDTLPTINTITKNKKARKTKKKPKTNTEKDDMSHRNTAFETKMAENNKDDNCLKQEQIATLPTSTTNGLEENRYDKYNAPVDPFHEQSQILLFMNQFYTIKDTDKDLYEYHRDLVLNIGLTKQVRSGIIFDAISVDFEQHKKRKKEYRKQSDIFAFANYPLKIYG